MTLLYNPALHEQPGTHVLAIGVGSYPHLLDGSKKLANKPLGLNQLQSPPVSLKAMLNWFLAPVMTPGVAGFTNEVAPLASVEALASSSAQLVIDTPTGTATIDAATRQNIQAAFEAWLARLKSHPDNVGVFYYCGHGFMASDDYLLAEDFGCSDAQPWAHAFDISKTVRAVEREVQGAVYYFIDACREVKRDVAMTLGADPIALQAVDLNKPVVQKSVTAIYATGEGERAFAPKGGVVSRFTSALLCVMSGYSGTKSPGEETWNVGGENIATAVRQLLEHNVLDTPAKTGTGKQVCDQLIRGISVPLLRTSNEPKVKVWLDLTPSQQRALYELYLLSAKWGRMAQTLLDQVFQIEVPRGFYEEAPMILTVYYPLWYILRKS